MGKVLISEWNIIAHDDNNINYNNIKNAQKKIKQLKNPLAASMLKTVIESYMTNGSVMSDVANIINEWSMINKENDLNKTLKCLLDSIFYSDLKHLFFVEEGTKVNLWIIIENKNFANSKKYIRKIREVGKESNLDIEYFIFDLEDKVEVIEQIKMENENYLEYL